MPNLRASQSGTEAAARVESAQNRYNLTRQWLLQTQEALIKAYRELQAQDDDTTEAAIVAAETDRAEAHYNMQAARADLIAERTWLLLSRKRPQDGPTGKKTNIYIYIHILV